MSLESISTGINRRRFLATSALAGAGLILSSKSLEAQNANVRSTAKKSGDTINVALVGCGAQGEVLVDSLIAIVKEARRPIGVNVIAVCDIWDYRKNYLANKFKGAGITANGYNDLEDMIAKEKNLDAVFVATPDFWHAPNTITCLKAGLHVYCEKMMAHTADAARSMVRAMKETGKLLQIGHQRRSNPYYIWSYQKIIKGNKLLGRITNANAQWNRGVQPDLKMPPRNPISAETLKKYGYDNAHEFRNWRWFKKYSGGPISDLGAHQIDIFNWVFGRPTSVIAAGGVDYYKSHEWYDNVMCIFAYNTPEGVARAYYQVLTTTSSGGGYFENFMGDNASLKLSENPNLIKLYKEATSAADWDPYKAENIIRLDTTPPPAKPSTAQMDSRDSEPPEAYDIPVSLGNKKIHQPHVENFLRAIKGEAKLNCDGAEAFESEAPIYRVNEAVAAEKMLHYTEADFAV
ncbi:MAG: Gfo/Idh/MocA family oxidoreductase [Puniceicoccales bacterium]|jgi:predicted dehydrogenase|nr:Gfo/Idh/MocA family oxidoreductase [Puniceicoccales bacterium]